MTRRNKSLSRLQAAPTMDDQHITLQERLAGANYSNPKQITGR
jgi:hypothetical protein